MNRFLPMPELIRAVDVSFLIALALVGVMMAIAAFRRRARRRQRMVGSIL